MMSADDRRTTGQRASVILALALCLVLLGTLDGHPVLGSTSPAASAAARTLTPGYGALPLLFEPNVGQAPREVKYLAHTEDGVVALTEHGMFLSLTDGRDEGRSTTIRLSPVGGSAHPRLVAMNR